MLRLVITREDDDITLVLDGEEMPTLRASIGGNKEIGFYLVFRGDPGEVAEMLATVNDVAAHALPGGAYEDKRSDHGKPE